MLLPLNVNNQSVDSSGITHDYKEAINEFIWNGFEANASCISVNSVQNELTGIKRLMIRDNGDGIRYSELRETFGAFLASKKRLLSLKEKTKVNKGKGRFSFAAFAERAEWTTVYKDNNDCKKFTITMSANQKEVVECSEPVTCDNIETGTEVIFTNINKLTKNDIDFEVMEPALLREFAWFLYLYKDKKLIIKINDISLDYTKCINEKFSETINKNICGKNFSISLIVWKEQIKENFCCYYFDGNNAYKGKNTTTFNRKTLQFSHSVYVRSTFFDNVDPTDSNYTLPQSITSCEISSKKIFNELNKTIKTLISKKVKSYLAEKADSRVDDMINVRNTFPTFSNDFYGKMRQHDLKQVVKEIYKIEPMFFHKLNQIQERSLLGFLNLLLSSEERESVLTIIEQIVELSSEQRIEFAGMLKKTALENVINTIRFLEERFRVIEILRSIVYSLNKFANERLHIQKIVEQNCWIFGEQYNLASADQRMKKSLEQYINILYGESNVNATLTPDVENRRRMDIFLCDVRNIESSFGAVQEENIIVELKAPDVVLSKSVYRQIEDYMAFVIRQPDFNSIFRRWKFIAVCKDVDDDIRSRYRVFEDKGQLGLVYKADNYEIYAFTWDDIVRSFEIKYKPLLDKLKYDREQIANELMTDVAHLDGREKVDALTHIAMS